MILAFIFGLATWQVVVITLGAAVLALGFYAMACGGWEPDEANDELQRTALKRWEGSE